jgi:hypothetical protein
MATFNSNQLDRLLSTPVVHIRSDEHGRVRAAYWEFPKNTTDAPLTTDSLQFVRLPPGARIIGGQFFNEVITAAATLSIGIAGATTKYVTTQAISAASAAGGVPLIPAGGGTFAAPIAGEVQAAAVTLIGTLAGANWTANKRSAGYVLYLGVE